MICFGYIAASHVSRFIGLSPHPLHTNLLHPTHLTHTPHPLLNDRIFGFMTQFEFPPFIFALSNSLVLFIHTRNDLCINFFAICRGCPGIVGREILLCLFVTVNANNTCVFLGVLLCLLFTSRRRSHDEYRISTYGITS